MLHCRTSLSKIGKELDTYCKKEELTEHLGTPNILELRDKQGTPFVCRQDDPQVGLVPPPHAEGWPLFEEESVYIHVIRMVALAIDKDYQFIAKKCAKNHDGTCKYGGIKGYARIRSKVLSREDHANEVRPRPALNIDVNRNCCTFKTWETLLGFAKEISEHPKIKVARIKNGFALNETKAAESFHLRVFMMNLLYTPGKTYGSLFKEKDVKKMWEEYVSSPPEDSTQSWYVWRQHAMAAFKHLSSPEMTNRPVKLIVESQVLLEKYKKTRDEMHMLYKVVRADSDKALYIQFAVGDEDTKEKKEQAMQAHKKNME